MIRRLLLFPVLALACAGDDGGASASSDGTGSSGSDGTDSQTSTTQTGSASGSDSASGTSTSVGTNASDSASGSGGTGDPPSYTCMAGGVADGSQVDPEVKKELMGTDGTVADYCDENGNLVEVLCETETECGPGPNPECTTTQTGTTTTQEFDCNGTCEDGTCYARCPDYDDPIAYVRAGEPAIIQDKVDDRTYSCTLIFDQMNDTYDCSTDPMAGDTTTIIALGLSSQFCTGGVIGNIQTATGCSYTCTLL